MQRPDEKKTGTDWNWTSYFAAKKQKLNLQYNQDRDELDEADESKNIFRNIGIIVNGYTNPTAIELKALMIKHGGYYFEYMNDRVTYIVASNLAHSKALALKNKTVIRPEWIVDCIKEKKLLSIDNYLLVTSIHDKAQHKLTNFFNNNEKYTQEKKVNRKSCTPIFIDISKSPVREIENKNQIDSEDFQQKYLKDYKNFRLKLKRFTECTKNQAKNLNINDARIECIKNFLNDWIVWTSNKNSSEIKSSYLSRANQEQIDQNELFLFKNYLLFILLEKKNFEFIRIILKIMKRLIQLNGSFEWIDAYKDLCSSIQSEFYEKYDVILNLD